MCALTMERLKRAKMLAEQLEKALDDLDAIHTHDNVDEARDSLRDYVTPCIDAEIARLENERLDNAQIDGGYEKHVMAESAAWRFVS